jgi:DNA polymerase III subunit delta
MTFEAIMSSLKNKEWKPLYFLEGDEPYFIQKISACIEENALTDAEKSFNQTMLYGADSNFNQVNDNIRRFPMMAEKQVVILKEAQRLKDFKKLENYFLNPVPTTIFVVHYNGKKIDKRTKLAKALQKQVYFTSDKIREYQLAPWLNQFVESNGFSIDTKSVELLIEHLGNDLQKIENSLEKLYLNKSKEKTITVDDIEKYIGISKDYNIFELNNAMLKGDVLKANQIIRYFHANPKAGPLPMLFGALYNLFERLLLLQQSDSHDKNYLAGFLGVNAFFVKDYLAAARLYDYDKTKEIIGILSEYDIKSKGVNAATMTPLAIMEEMIFKIMH